MLSWNIKKLENVVRLEHGDNIADNLREPLQSFYWKMALYTYHSNESISAINDIVENSELTINNHPSTVTATYLLFLSATNDPKAKQFRMACFCSEAHLIAAAQALHSAIDITGCAIFWALNFYKLDCSPKIEELSLSKANEFLKRRLKEREDIGYRKIATGIDKLLGSHQFAYLNAYVNTVKHRSLVQTNYSIDFEPNLKYGLKIMAFQYNAKRKFKEIWSERFLKDGRDIQNKLLIIGNAINDYYS